MGMNILQVHYIWLEAIKHLAEFAPGFRGVNKPSEYLQPCSQIPMPVQFSKVNVTDKQVGIWIQQVPLILHGKEGDQMPFASEQFGQIKRVGAIAAATEVASVDQ